MDEARYDLYRRYIEARHADGDMYPPSPSQYESFLASSSDHAFFLEARLEDRLIAVTLFDEIPGMDSQQSTRSLIRTLGLIREVLGV